MHWGVFVTIMLLQYIGIVIFNKNLNMFRNGVRATKINLETYDGIPEELYPERDGIKEMLDQAIEQTKTYSNMVGLTLSISILAIFIYSIEHPSFLIPFFVGLGLVGYGGFLFFRLKVYTHILNEHIGEFMGEVFARTIQGHLSEVETESDVGEIERIKVDKTLLNNSSSFSDKLDL